MGEANGSLYKLNVNLVFKVRERSKIISGLFNGLGLSRIRVTCLG